MPLSPGTRLASYEIVAALGAGGMGEVYRARDTKLGRDVAIKILPPAFAQDPERVARFQREAQLLAALNHPHIAAIHGLEEAAESPFLVLELVEGETLAERLGRSQDRLLQPPAEIGRERSSDRSEGIALDEALRIARQIADALQAAHDKGIIHRDLKPANIALTAEGQVKVLDFGLAKALGAAEGARALSPLVTNSPTLTFNPTMTGMILGTAAYMSPEQAKGRDADKRTDVWAFGCVLFEMLTGKKAFDGEDATDIIAAVVRGEPDWKALPSETPAAIRTLLKGCLEKDRRERIADVSTVLFVLKQPSVIERSDDAVPKLGPPEGGTQVLPWAAAAALATTALIVTLVLWAPWKKASPPVPLRLNAELGADVTLVSNQGPAAILSPNGEMLAFVAQKTLSGDRQLYIRHLDELQATPLSGTVGALEPFFSPDRQWIGFFADGKLKKISARGGAAVTLCDAPAPRGGSWADDGSIAFQPGNGSGTALWRVSSAGGKPESFTTLGDGEVTQRWPQMLPGSKAVLYSGHTSTTGWDDARVTVQALPNGPRKILQRDGYFARYLSSGHIVYIHESTLFAVPFDLDRLEVAGQPAPVLEGIASTPAGGASGAAQVAASSNGTLAYLPGGSVGADAPIAFVDHTGKATPLRATPANWSNPRFSPDGTRLAMDIFDGKQTDVWISDWSRDTLTRLTFAAGRDETPVWTPDGRRVVFASTRGGALNLYWQRADGTGDVERLTESKNDQAPGSWHPSGKFLAFVERNPQTNGDLMILPMEGDDASGWKPGEPTIFLNSPFLEREPAFSPDGKWLAYISAESGREEIYVRPFPGPGGKWQISTNGGVYPFWSRTRRELFYGGSPDQRFMVATYSVDSDSFRADKPRVWSELSVPLRPRGGRASDLHPDGERWAMAPVTQNETAAKQDKVVFVFNFFDELRRIAPLAH